MNQHTVTIVSVVDPGWLAYGPRYDRVLQLALFGEEKYA
jgi:hypothetical protein